MASDRYQASGPEGEWQPGSAGQVLRNRPGITDPAEIDKVELELLLQLYDHVLQQDFPDHRLSVADISEWHRLWLGNLYDWAGRERSVNIGKDGFHFAASSRISSLLNEFEQKFLHRYTPCHDLDGSELEEAIAACHVEFILIHPFREGNGRIARLLADVMAVQAGRELLDYSAWDADKAVYFAAIQRGMEMDYSPMRALVSCALAARNE